MKAFTCALAILLLTLGIAIANDVYCNSVCIDIEDEISSKNEQSARKALDEFERNEFILKLSVDNGYVSEAEVSLRSLVSAYEHNDSYEISRYIADTLVRIRRVRRALLI